MKKELDHDCVAIEDRLVGYDELVDAELASKIIGLSPRTIRDMAVRREIPVYRVSNNVTRYLVRDLVEWSEGKRCEPAGEATSGERTRHRV